jgi:hypothetical protein
MQYIGLTGSLSSGKLGGLVGSRGRGGNQLRARIVPRQSLTVSSSEARHITGGLPALWRLLTPAEHETWATLAEALPVRDALGQSVTLSGYSLYIACARRLITIGIIEPLRAAPALPSIPPIYGFEATPIYNAPGASSALEDIQLTTANPLPTNFTPVLRASAALSPTRFNIRASNLRVIQAGVMWPSEPYGVLALWHAVYGTYPPAGTITFELSLVDPISGLVGAAVRAATSYSYTPTPAPTPGTVTVEVEGVTIAEIPDTYFQVEGITAAS